MAEMQNIRGRKWGRGIRPWLLMPKYVCVALVIGGLFAVGVLGIASQFATSEEPSRFAWTLLRAVFRWQVIPATAGAVLFGVLLLMRHPREFLRMRWMRTKLSLVAVLVPGAHLWLSTRVEQMSEAGSSPSLLIPITLAVLALLLLITLLGRLKPRLRQPYAKARV